MYSLVTHSKCLIVTKMNKKNDKKSMFRATNLYYCVCNGIENTAKYFLLNTKAFQKAFWQAFQFLRDFCTPTP